MMKSNKIIVERFLSEFYKRSHNSYITYLAEDIKWNIVGMPPINGKQNFLEALELMEVWQSSVKRKKSSTGSGTHVIAEGDFVVIENQDFSLTRNRNHFPAHCDIYRINNGKIKEVITYLVDTSTNE